jgi:phosphate transport system substrate-binding protein
MTSREPGPYQTITDLSRDLLRQAYPNQEDEWIKEKADYAARSIKSTAPQQFQAAKNAVSARRRPDLRRRIVRWAIAAAAAIGVGVLVVVEREWITAALAKEGGLFTVAVIALLALATTIWWRVRERYEKVLSCRVRIDTQFGGRFDLGDQLQLTGPGATTVEDPGMVVVRIKNLSDAVIDPEDYLEPLRLRFPDRRVRTVEVTESEPPGLQDTVASHADFRYKAHYITLPSVELKPDNSYYVVALLSGTKADQEYEVPLEGRIRRGWITTEATIPWIRRRTIAAGAVTAVASGVLVVALLLNNVRPFSAIPDGLVCVPGTLTVEGSSAFSPAATLAGTEYHAYCPKSTIDVRGTGSVEGLKRLHDAPADTRSTRLALSDGRETLGFTELVGHPVAVVPFTFAVNNSVPIVGLRLDQARNIFTGGVGKWSEITNNTANPADVRVVVRSDNSGTRLTLQQHVLGNPKNPVPQAAATSDDCLKRRPGLESAKAIVCERGSTSDVLNRTAALPDTIGYADVGDVTRTSGVKPVNVDGLRADLDGINNGYPFWTVEYVYSYGGLPDGSLAKAFTDYLSQYLLRVQSEAQTKQPPKQPDYYACDADRVQALCSRNDR